VDNQLHGYGRLRCTETFFLAAAAEAASGAGSQARPEARWQNCREYVGQFAHDKRHGVGVMTCRDGSVLAGTRCPPDA
jgi:hypothetical protein